MSFAGLYLFRPFAKKTSASLKYYLPRVILRYLSRIRGFCCEALLHSSLPFLSARACCGFAGLPACSTESRAGLPPSCFRSHPTVASPLLWILYCRSTFFSLFFYILPHLRVFVDSTYSITVQGIPCFWNGKARWPVFAPRYLVL